MDTLNVGYSYSPWSLTEARRRSIEKISPRIKIKDISELVDAESRLTKELRGSSQTEKAKADLSAALADVEVLFCGDSPDKLLSRAPKLRWLQCIWDGVDTTVAPEVIQSHVVVTNARGTASIAIAEWVLTVMVMFSKRIPAYFADKVNRKWDPRPDQTYELGGKTVGIVGMGDIGKEVARLAKAYYMRVRATRRSAVVRQVSVGDVDELLPLGDLPHLLSESDFVVLCVPLNRETSKMIGERELKLMRPTAYLINIARGGVIQEPALIKALQEGWIAGAALDVFSTEPLPSESEIWNLPNVIFTPHISGETNLYVKRMDVIFCENLRRYVAGEELSNVVDKNLGYPLPRG